MRKIKDGIFFLFLLWWLCALIPVVELAGARLKAVSKGKFKKEYLYK